MTRTSTVNENFSELQLKQEIRKTDLYGPRTQGSFVKLIYYFGNGSDKEKLDF